jgi:hypothetical protein
VGPIKEELAHRLRVGVLAAACGLLFTGAIYQETFECEEAIAHLQDCCPELYAINACGDGCSGVSLQGGESQCIVERDCDELEALEVCDRVEELSEGAFGTDNDERGWVCP